MPKITGIPDVRFNLKSIKDKNKSTLISAVFRYPYQGNTERLVYSSRLKVEPKHWDAKKQLPRPTYKDYGFYKDTLNRIAESIRDIYLQNDTGKISIQAFKEQLDIDLRRVIIEEQVEATSTLTSYIETFIEKRKTAVNANRHTWKKFVTVQNHLIQFAKDTHRDGLNFEDIDWPFRKDFENWLYKKPRQHSTNNASKIIQVLKQFMVESKRENKHDNGICEDPTFRIKRVGIKKPILTFDEIKLIHDLDLSDDPKLDRVRDLFLIGCYTGLRISDFTRIRPEHIIEEKGIELIHLFTVKGKTEVFVPVTPELKEILNKHENRSPEPISSQRMNEYIKDVCELAELDRPIVVKYSKAGREKEDTVPLYSKITAHTARRSYATHHYDMGISSAYIRQVTGHSSEKMLSVYVNSDKKKNALEMAKQVANIMRKNSSDGH